MNFIPYIPQLAEGLLTTITLMLCALAVGIVLAFIMTLGILSKHAAVRAPIHAFVFFIRGTPLLVQIFLIYFGSGQFEWLQNSPLWIVLREPFACAVIALALNTCAYTIVILKGAIDSVPEGEVIAGHALGMSYWQTLFRVVLPRAFRIVLPAYSNEVIIVLKSTSLASTITILDLMGVANHLAALTYATMPFLIIAGLLYLVMNYLIVLAFKMVERRVNRYLVVG